MPEEPRMIKERFRIDSLIAYGGMARVYKGTDLTLARTVAVKVLSEDLARDPNFLLRFRREAQAAAALTHPNIVGVYDTGAEAGVHYIVMEYVEGMTLQEVLAEEGPLDPDRAAAIGADVARALGAAHAKGIVHRDIKPGNIMIGDNGHVKVMDFGIAKAAASGSLTQVGAILGTVAYLSPEQARGEDVDGRSDIYSLGAMVYQMLTGRAPFVAETLMEMVNKLNNQAPTAVMLLNPAVPPALEAVVMRALAKDRDRRFQDADDFAAQLLGSIHGDPSATAAYVAPPAVPAGVPDRTVVAPSARRDESRTAVMPAARVEPGVYEREFFPMKNLIVGGILVLALALLGVFIFSNLTDTPSLADPSPTPPTTTLPAVQIQPPATTQPAPSAPETTTTTTTTTLPPEPSPEPPVEEPPPEEEPPPTDPDPPIEEASGNPSAGKDGEDGGKGQEA